MTDLKAPPQNEWLARAAELLRSGRNIANDVSLPQVTKALPIIGALLNSGKLGDTTFGRSPEGVEQMSYGEAPITLPTLAKPMGFPKNEEGGLRAMDQLEGLGTLPMAGPLTAGAKGAGSLAIMAPYIKGSKGLPGFQTPAFEKASAEAVRLLRQGKTSTEVGQETGMWVVPRGGNRHTLSDMDPDNAMFMVEIPDSKMTLKPDFIRAITDNKHRKSMHMLPDAIDFKNGFKIAPHLREMRVSSEPMLDSVGAYNFPTGTIRINPYNTGSLDDTLGVVNHELQHGMQYHTNNLAKYEGSMPGGGSPAAWEQMRGNTLASSDKQGLAQDIEFAVNPGPHKDVPREIRNLHKFLKAYTSGMQNPRSGYDKLLGEQQAEASRKRMQLTAGERLERAPYEDYTMGHPFKGAPGLDMRDVQQADQLFTAQPYVNNEDYVHELLKILRTNRNPLK